MGGYLIYKKIMLFYIICISILIIIAIQLLNKNGIGNELGSTHDRKIHTGDSSRIGGLVIISTLPIFFYLESSILLSILAFAYLIFTIGFIEDIKKNTSPYLRITLLTLIIYIFIINNEFIITNFDNESLNFISNNYFLSTVFITIGLLFLVNGSNFIDGLNGLLLGTSLITIFLFAYYSYGKSDEMFLFCSGIAASIIILFFINFFFGKILTGDGGSYFLGFIIGCLAILMSRNSILKESQIACIIFYPVTEVIFTFIRRILFEKSNPFKPDGKHLHQLVYKIVVINNWGILANIKEQYLNSLCSLIICLAFLSVMILRDIIENYIDSLIIFMIFIIIYIVTYLLISFFYSKANATVKV